MSGEPIASCRTGSWDTQYTEYSIGSNVVHHEFTSLDISSLFAHTVLSVPAYPLSLKIPEAESFAAEIGIYPVKLSFIENQKDRVTFYAFR